MLCFDFGYILSAFSQPQKKHPAESSISPFYFNSELKKWLPLPRDQVDAIPPFSGRNSFDDDVAFGTWKLCCYNISGSDEPLSEARIDAILHLLLKEDADVICLQEVTPEFVDQIKKELWVQQGYILSDIESQSLHPQGVFMLSRLPLHPFYETYLPSKQQKKMLYADVYINEQSVVRIATSHLEGQRQNVREQQLESIRSVLLPESEKDKFVTSVICGDFNFAGPNEDSVLRGANFVDAWVNKYPENEKGAGYTLGVNYPSSNPSRNDRVYVCNHDKELQWEAVRFKLIGDEPIADGGEAKVFPSSHLGLSLTFTATWPN
ncbi:DNase I-like protein [Basidiobolus meristosporus CBS 931.73]|uniref:DNase I-like protein n=1 Tax=Basidiobolus meristosporus CBS 931.73 TaxID=1314790 RepID=A0A1Y1YG34_9FUNG|nr:DNase I-like protein [Basidiobolus meristosporus CBS 931.73]|eukprot:ORX96990.1 DNase I-like protein [Basidiobolus meristosporus CBS 931.73]